MLFIVPTPIGNLEDISIRAIRVLKEVDVILAEDTRTSKKLLDYYQIETQLRSYHAHNEHKIYEHVIQLLLGGQKLALISDAGTPGISDPGFLLVRACTEHNIPVYCLPGATAFVPALVASGLPCDRFHYEGFLPHKKGRQSRLEYLSQLPNTIVVYESPHRLIKAIEQLIVYFGEDRKAAVCREISKLHEETVRGSLQSLLIEFQTRPSIKGEIAIVIQGKS